MPGKIIEHFREDLAPYIDFDLLDCLNDYPDQPDKKFHVYLAEIKEEHLTLVPEHGSIIFKELSEMQLPIYSKIASDWNPYLETVFDILSKDSDDQSYYLAATEFISRPLSLAYHALPPERNIQTRSLTLEQYIKSFGCLSEQEALVFLYQLCEGLSVLHKNQLIHGDISPQNILLTDRFPGCETFDKISGIHQQISIKLIDFDIANTIKISNHTVTHAVGTLPYAAPEIIDFTNPTDRVDIYSLGCILCFMLTGKSPKDADRKQLSKLCSKQTLRIFQTCTANYELRYRKVSQLKKDIRKILRYPDNLFFNFLKQIPGFRSGHPIKMTISFHVSILYFLCMIGLSLDNIAYFLPMTLYWIFFLIIGFDMLHIEQSSQKFQQLHRLIPFAPYVIRCLLLFIIAMILSINSSGIQ